MALRGKLYHCHLFSFAGPQTEGVISNWTQNLIPIDEDEVISGEKVQLYVAIDGRHHDLTDKSQIRFDLIEQDHFLTGGPDDLIVSLLGTGATQPDADFQTVQKETKWFRLTELESLRAFVNKYEQDNADNLDQRIVVIEERLANYNIYHLLTWWTAERHEDYLNVEIYFIVSLDQAFDDQSSDILDVTSDRLPADAQTITHWDPRVATRRIYRLLTTSVLDWSVSDEEALEAFHLLRMLEPVALLRTVQLMRHNGTWRHLVEKMSGPELGMADDFLKLQMWIEPNFGYIVPGDRVLVEVIAGGTVDISITVRVSDRGLSLPMLSGRFADFVDVVGRLPVDAANVILRAYIEAQLFVNPTVTIKIVERGAPYIGLGRLAAVERAVEHRSTVTADPQLPEQQRLARFVHFTSYISVVRSRDPFTISALLHYHRWIEENREQPEFLTREPSDLWAWALERVAEPPPRTPMEPFLALMRSVQHRMEGEPPEDREHTQRAFGYYLDWIDGHWNDPNLGQIDPVDIWVRMAGRVTREDIDAMRRRIEEEARRPPPIEWEAVGTKLDEAIALMIRRVWTTPPPHVERGVQSSGGIFGLFEDRVGVSYLIQSSELERRVRNVIASEFLSAFMARATEQGFTELDVNHEFNTWLLGQPDMVDAFNLAQAYPDVERSEYEIELEDWQTALEIGIGFIPIVGQIVGVIEVVGGTSLFGRRLSTAERAIIGAAILLPAAGKLASGGARVMRASAIVKTYRLTGREAAAVYRAALPIRQGSPGARLLTRLRDDILEGRSVRDRNTISQVGELLDEMGMMDRRTAQALGLPARPALEGAAVASDRATAQLVREAFGGDTALYRGLADEPRQAIRAAAEIDPTYVRRSLRAETQEGFERYSREVIERMRNQNLPESQIQRFREVIDDLNQRVRTGLDAGIDAARTRQRIQELGELAPFRREGDSMLAEINRRLQRHRIRASASGVSTAERQRALNTVRNIEREIDALEAWIRPAGATPAARLAAIRATWDLEGFRRAVGNSPYLRRLVADGGGPMLRRIWIQHQTRSIRSSLARYTSIMQRHYRGNYGEFEVAFRLFDDFIILKPPDEFVTQAGIDLIVIPRGGRGLVTIIDNKALSRQTERSVSALTRNLPRNLAADLDEFANLMARDPNLPSEFAEAMQRLTIANSRIQTLVGGMSRDTIGRSTMIQQQITQILRENQIERIVTNAGGQLDNLSPRLRGFGIDLADMN